MNDGTGAVTIWDVAQASGVSKSTAARALSDNGSVSPATRQRVREAAKCLGYRPNAVAKAMARGRTNTIAAVIPDVASPFFSSVVRGLSDVARSAGFEVVLSNTDNDCAVEDRALDVLSQKRVDGIVIAPVLQQGRSTEMLDAVASQIPTVFIDRDVPESMLRLPLVTVDHVTASALAVRHLLELGHRCIGIVTETMLSSAEVLNARSSYGLWPSSQRFLGYLQELSRWGIPPDESLVIRTQYDSAAADEHVTDVLRSTFSATALYCTDSTVTLGAYQALRRANIRIPQDLSFVGFDEQDWTTLVSPTITVVDQPRVLLGLAAGNQLMRRLAEPTRQLAPMLLDASLIERESTCPLNESAHIREPFEG